ncbi:MAG: aminotransferase class I/II-fold pyridoxal phosphate-dependent enzyme [Chthoniobacterales bacterium]
MNLGDWLGERLAEIEAAHLRRSLRTIESAQGPIIERDGRTLINFSSNDYLGLANDPRLKNAAATAIERFGAGAGSARLISGTQTPHEDLETALAKFKRTEAALTFATGHAAALGSIPALVGAEDVVILDKLCHACLVDAARLSGATIRVFPHNHLDKLASHLAWARENYAKANVLVVTESVFSMDGDRAPLREIVELKDRFGAWLLVDEAHGIGVIGENGRGLAAELGVGDRIEIQMGTLGKALGSSGGAICGSRQLVDFLVNRARSFIFSTAPVPAAAAAALEAVRLLDSGEAEPLREKLWANIRSLDPAAASAIVPRILGEESATVAASERLLEAGLLVPAIRYPTVARGQARLRISLSAAHTPEQIGKLKIGLTGPF